MFGDSIPQRLDRTLHISFNNKIQILDFASGNTPIQIIERHAICLGELLGTESVLAYTTDMTCLPFIFNDRKGITCCRDIGKTKHFNRSRRPGKRDFAATIIKHRPYAAMMHTGYICVTDV